MSKGSFPCVQHKAASLWQSHNDRQIQPVHFPAFLSIPTVQTLFQLFLSDDRPPTGEHSLHDLCSDLISIVFTRFKCTKPVESNETRACFIHSIIRLNGQCNSLVYTMDELFVYRLVYSKFPMCPRRGDTTRWFRYCSLWACRQRRKSSRIE